MKLPNGDRAVIPIAKLLGYCLNPNHPKGKHKARVFKSALGITTNNVEQLVRLIQRAAVQGEVVQARTTDFGQEFKLDCLVDGHDELQLRTIWIISHDSTEPQLVSALIK
jgi:hypothetical protein